ncbi:MAG: prepilin-type N-terminal cleavage/methylation domain-containing protein [Pseudomonadota bacterium]
MRKRPSGFTLIEMILAVFLIGLTAVLVVVNAEYDQDDRAQLEAERFTALVRHLQGESIIVGYPLGVRLEAVDNQYRFYALQDQWQLLTRDEVLRPRAIPEGVIMTLSVAAKKNKDDKVDEARSDGEDDDSDQKQSSSVSTENMIVVEPTGLTTQFVANFTGDSTTYTITVDTDQKLVLSDNKGNRI